VAESLAALVARHAETKPGALAYASEDRRLTWREYDEWSDAIAGALVARGLQPGQRIAVQLPDGPGLHAAFLGCEKAGVVVVGIGARAGRREVDHLLTRTGARELVTSSGRCAVRASETLFH